LLNVASYYFAILSEGVFKVTLSSSVTQTTNVKPLAASHIERRTKKKKATKPKHRYNNPGFIPENNRQTSRLGKKKQETEAKELAILLHPKNAWLCKRIYEPASSKVLCYG